MTQTDQAFFEADAGVQIDRLVKSFQALSPQLSWEDALALARQIIESLPQARACLSGQTPVICLVQLYTPILLDFLPKVFGPKSTEYVTQAILGNGRLLQCALTNLNLIGFITCLTASGGRNWAQCALSNVNLGGFLACLSGGSAPPVPTPPVGGPVQPPVAPPTPPPPITSPPGTRQEYRPNDSARCS